MLLFIVGQIFVIFLSKLVMYVCRSDFQIVCEPLNNSNSLTLRHFILNFTSILFQANSIKKDLETVRGFAKFYYLFFILNNLQTIDVLDHYPVKKTKFCPLMWQLEEIVCIFQYWVIFFLHYAFNFSILQQSYFLYLIWYRS